MEAKYELIETPATYSWRYSVHRNTQFDFGWHAHEEIELTLITSGCGQRLVGDSIESYTPGDLVLIGSKIPHAYVSTTGNTDNTAVVAQLKRDFLGPEFFNKPEFVSVGQLLDRANHGLAFPRKSVAQISAQLRSFDSMKDADRTLSLLHVLLQLATTGITARALSSGRPRHSLNHAARARINDVCGYLNNAYTGPVSLAEMARLAHMSPAALSRFFRRTIGRTLTAYVTELRIGAACRLLIDTDLPIIDVATRSGYNNLSNFNRRFRTAKGMTPREYRATFQRTAAM